MQYVELESDNDNGMWLLKNENDVAIGVSLRTKDDINMEVRIHENKGYKSLSDQEMQALIDELDIASISDQLLSDLGIKMLV